MKNYYNPWKRYALSLVLTLLSTIVLAQVHQGVVRIKLTETKAAYVQHSKIARTAQGYVRTGDVKLDGVLAQCRATNMKRVFRPAGKFEAKHRKYGLHLWYEVSFDKSVTVSTALNAFKGLSDVKVSEPIYEKEIIGYNPNTLEKKVVTLNSDPTDPLYGDQWHYNNTGQTGGTPGADISLPQAWSIETGNSDVIVAVTDGGIDVAHEDLAASMWVNTGEIPDNGIDDDGNGYVDDVNGYGFGDNTGSIPADLHGTHVGGTVAAVTNNGVGVAGVAGGDGSGNGVRLMSCAAFGESSTGGFAETYIYGADMGAVISQNSWGYTNPGVFEQAVLDAIDYFIAEAGFDELGNPNGPMQGGVVIFAAGNDGTDDDWYPGIYEPIIAVGGTDHNDDEYVFSNRGDWVDVAAPAVSVLSTLPNNQYGNLTGTSMACPHVSGLAGLIVSQNLGNITPVQLRARIEQTTDPLPGLEFLGTGRINAFAALQQDDGVAPDAISDLSIAGKDLSSVTLSWTAPADAGNGSATTYDIRYSTSAISSGNFDAATPVSPQPGASLAGTVENFTISGLDPSTTYYFAIKSADFFNNISAISNVVSETTDDPPSAAVDPTSLTSNLTTGESENQTLTLSNTGNGPLEYELSFGGTSFTPASMGAAVKDIRPHSKLLSSVKAYSSAVETLAGDQYGTGFESFTLGDIDGQDGWSGDFSNWNISDTSPFSGSQHVEAISEMLPSGASYSLAFSPNVGVGVEEYSSTTAKLSVDNSGVSWQFIPQSPTEELIVTRVSFDADGTISIYDGDAGDFVAVPADVPSGYFDLKLVVNRASFDMNLYIDNELVYVGKAVTGDIEQVVLLSTMEQDGNQFLMDDLSIYDGMLDTYPFLTASSTGGIVPGNSEKDIDITFDASGLFGGTYENEIQIKTNDPANPSFIIPATLNVTGTGKPVIDVQPGSITFDDTFVGGTSTAQIEISNSGTEILNVSDITTTGDFSVSGGTSLTIMPFESEIVEVSFSPSALGSLNGVLTVNNNDADNPAVEVSLTGTGVEAPAITVNPGSFTAELERGNSTTEVLTITNDGVAPLEFAIETNEVEASSTSVNIVIEPRGKEGQIKSSANTKQKLGSSFTGIDQKADVRLSATALNVLVISPDDDVTDLTSTLGSFPDINATTYVKEDLPGIALSDLTPYDVVVTTNNTQWLASGSVDPALVGDLLADYIDQGGKVIANSFAYDYDAWALEGRFITENYGPFTSTSTDFSGSTSLGTIHAPDHPVMEGVSNISNSYLWQDPGLASGATLLADWNDGNHFAAANENVVALNILPSNGEGVPGWTGDLAVLYHNAVLWLTGSGFVSTDIESGVLAQGESVEVNVTISAEGLESGYYQATIDVSSNDPVNPLVQVPVDLNVLGPAVTANPEAIDVTVLKGLSDSRTLTLANNGSADAEFMIDIVNGSPDTEPSAVVDTKPVRAQAFAGAQVSLAAPVNKSSVSTQAEGDEVYSTGFENFSIGSINGQQGWIGQYGNWRVENFDPKSGAQHFQGLSDGLGQSISYTPLLDLGGEAITTASMDVYLEDGVSWWISTESLDAINARVIFDPDGNVVMVSDDGAGGAKLDTLDFTIPNDYFNIAFEVNKSSQEFKFYINSTQVYEGDAFSGDLEYVVVLSLMETAGPVFNLDNLDVYEGRYVPDFLTLSEYSGMIPAGSSVDIDLNFDGSNTPYGTFYRDLLVYVNEASTPDLVVPTTFTVTGDPAIEVTPQVLEQIVNYKESETQQFMVKNTGGQPIDFAVSVLGADLSSQDMQFEKSARPEMSGQKYEQYVAYQSQQKPPYSVTKLMAGETLYEEDFDGGTFPPSGWTVVDNEGSGLQWDVLDVHGLENWSGSGEAASVNSDANQGVEFDTELITPSINIDGRTGVAVQYNVNYINFIGSDYLDLDVSTDGGSSWTTVLSWNESHGSFFAAPGESVSVELDDYITGASSMQLRWRYYDPNSGDWDYYVQIDDIKVMADANAWLVVDPAIGTVPVGQEVPVNVTFDASKVDPDEYYAGILVNSNAANAPVASVFAIMDVLEPAEIEVNPTELEQTLVSGFSDTQTLSITNNGESILRYNLGGFAKDARIVSVSKESSERIEGNKRTQLYDGPLFTGKKSIQLHNVNQAAKMPVYGTDFESFDLGDIDGQNDWLAQYGNWTVETANPQSGNQHFRGLSDGLGQSIAITPNVGIGSEATSTFSTDMQVDGSDVTWQLIPQSSTAELVVTRIQVNPDGSLDALVDDGAGNPVFEQVMDAVPSGYFKLQLESNRSTGMYDLYINKEHVFSGQGFAGDIEEVVILSLMEVSGPTLDLDDLNIWDGAAPIPFLSTNPEFGNVASGETVEIEVTFDASDLEKGIYNDEIIVFNNDPNNNAVNIPVTLEVINPPAMEVTPQSIESYVYMGTTKDHTVTITNTGEANLRFGFAGYGDAPEPGVFARHSDSGLSELQIAKKLKDDKGSRPQTYAKAITFMEGEQLLFEDFENGVPPEGWSVIDNEGGGVVWESSSNNYTGGTGNAAMANSDAAGNVEYDTELITPAIDVDGKAGVVVQYYVNYQNYLNNDFLDVDISTDGGSTWTTVLSWNEDHGSLNSVPGEYVSLELDDYLTDASTMQLRWHYYNPNSGDWDWYAEIDEVEVIYEGIQWLTMDPAQGVLGEGESMDITVTFDATEIEQGTHTKELLLLTNVPDEPEVVLNMTMHAVMVEDLELAAACSDNPDEERRWEVNNPNPFEVDAYWFIVGSNEGDSISVAPGVSYFSSPTQTDRPNTVKIKWLDHTGAVQENTAESSGLPCLVEDLNLTSMCSNNPDLFRRWRVRNPNPFRVMINWQVVGTSQSGVLYAAGDDDTFFYTEAIDGPNTTIIKWLDEEGVEQQKVKASSGEVCDVDNSCFGGDVIAFEQGLRKKGTAVPPRRSNPANALGLPEENDEINFVSLGIGGSLTIKLNNVVVDQPGNDFMVIETSFNDVGKPCDDYPERAEVYASIDGETFYLLGTACKDTEFDIAVSGLMEIEYLKFVDVTDINARHIGPAADGFDLDGVYCLNNYYSAAVQQSFGHLSNKVPDEAADELIAFPNPFKEQIAIKTQVDQNGRYLIRVHDMYGSLVAEKVVYSTFGQIDAQIDAIHMSSGTYLITVTSEDETYRSSHVLIKE